MVEECTKSAVGKTDRCIAHGGGHRCQEPECVKSALRHSKWGENRYCQEHGGYLYLCTHCDFNPALRSGGQCGTCKGETRRVKELELMVKEHLEANEHTAHFSYYDTTLPCAPNRRRPDFV